MFTVSVINGPNLNLLGIREPKIYGHKNLSDVISDLQKTAVLLNIILSHFQSNAEHELIDYIHKCYYKKIDFIIINPASFTHTSIALRDSLLSTNISFIEVHISNIYSREKFRHHSYFSNIAMAVICGFGIDGYHFSLHMAHKYLSKNK